MCLRLSYMKKKNFFASLKSQKKGIGVDPESGSICQRYGSADTDPNQNVTDPQNCFRGTYLQCHLYTPPPYPENDQL